MYAKVVNKYIESTTKHTCMLQELPKCSSTKIIHVVQNICNFADLVLAMKIYCTKPCICAQTSTHELLLDVLDCHRMNKLLIDTSKIGIKCSQMAL